MNLSQLNAEDTLQQQHDAKRTAHLLLAIDTLTECYQGLYGTTQFIQELRRTAERIQTLADAVENQAKTPKSNLGPSHQDHAA